MSHLAQCEKQFPLSLSIKLGWFWFGKVDRTSGTSLRRQASALCTSLLYLHLGQEMEAIGLQQQCLARKASCFAQQHFFPTANHRFIPLTSPKALDDFSCEDLPIDYVASVGAHLLFHLFLTPPLSMRLLPDCFESNSTDILGLSCK